jgi:hypothetical protein
MPVGVSMLVMKRLSSDALWMTNGALLRYTLPITPLPQGCPSTAPHEFTHTNLSPPDGGEEIT